MKTKLYFIITLFAFFTLIVLLSGFAQEPLVQPSVRLVYLLPNDRIARPDKVIVLRQLIKDAQQFFADEMQRHGFGRRTFIFESDKEGEPLAHRVTGRFAEEYYNRFTGQKAWEEIREYFDFDELHHIYFIAVDLESPWEGKHCGEAGATFWPSSGGAPQRRFYDTITQGEEILGGFAVIPASGHCINSSAFKLVAHELGHAFGLGHDFREGTASDYVMAYGNQTRLSKCAAEWLSVSPFFTINPISDNTPGEIRLISTPTYSTEGVRLRFEVTDTNGLHQAQLLLPAALGEELSDCKQLEGETSTIEFISTELTIEPVDSVMLQIIDVNGSITWATFSTDIASLLPDAQIISIPDANLAAAVRTELGLEHSAPITDMEMKKLTSLTYSGRDLRDNLKITDLTGLEYATSLEHLYLYGHRIHDISPLEGLPNLRSLWIAGNQIKNINKLTTLSLSLKTLDLGQNLITNFDPLVQLSQLTRLFLWGSGISDLSVLPQLPQLEFLGLSWNQISDVSPLAGFTNLKELYLQGNRLKDTSTLFQLRGGTFPPNEAVEVTEAQDDNGSTYTLLIFRSLDLRVRIKPGVAIFRSLNSVQGDRQPVPATNELVDDAHQQLTATDVLVEASERPPMYWVDTAVGTLHRLVGTEVENFLPSVQSATSLAVDMTGGKLYWTERISDRTGKIRRANLNGTNVKLVKDLTSVPHGIALDLAGGKIYLTNSWGKVQRLNFNGSNFQPNLITGLNTPTSLALDVSGGKLYWTEKTSDTTGKIQRANLNGTNVQLVKDLTSVPHGIALDTTNRKIYVTNSWGKVQRLDFDGSNFQPNLITHLESPEGIAVDAVNGKLYWTENEGIRCANLNGKNIQNVVTGLRAPASIVLSTPAVAALVPAAPATIVIVPDETDLHPNYPNPFNPETWIPYQLAKPADVTLCIYAANGALVRTLTLGHQPAGMYQSKSRAAYWDGKNELGEKVASGLYFYTLSTGDFTATRKMLILK